MSDQVQTSFVRIPEKEYHQLLSYKEQLTDLKRMIFGSKSERFVSGSSSQLGLFGKVADAKDSPTKTINVSYQRRIPNKEQAVRTVLPAHLPRVEETIEPDDLEHGAVKIGEEITEVLEYTPANLFVRKMIRPKYALKDKGIVIGQLPTLPLPKSNAGASLLAHIAVSKFVDHLPFYRQRQIFKRQQFVVSDSTLGGWFTQTADLLEPLYNTLQHEILKSNYIQADESPIGVQDSHKKGTLHTGYQWVYRSPVEQLALFRYQEG